MTIDTPSAHATMAPAVALRWGITATVLATTFGVLLAAGLAVIMNLS